MKKGFTLIELLIVVAIIGILAVALAPTITDAPARARDAARKTSVTKVLSAIEAYNLDYGSYPTGTFCIDGAAGASADETNLITLLGNKAPTSAATSDTTVCGGQYIRYEALSNGYQVFMSVEKTGTHTVSTGYADATTSADSLTEGGDGPGSGGLIDVFAVINGS